MKRTITILALLTLVSLPAFAQDESSPDFSKRYLQRFVADIPEPEPERDGGMHFYVGGVEFRTLGTKWAFNPVMPLSGTRLMTTSQLPDPFELSGTPIATGPRVWRAQRAMNAELKRIEKSERAKVRVKVQAQ